MSNIQTLKDRLREEYLHMQDIASDYSCGHELTKHVNAAYSKACTTVNATLDELAKLDPTTPTTRF